MFFLQIWILIIGTTFAAIGFWKLLFILDVPHGIASRLTIASGVSVFLCIMVYWIANKIDSLFEGKKE